MTLGLGRIHALRSRVKANMVAKQHDGQSLIEYALILVLVAAVIAGALTAFGGAIDTFYGAINSALP